MARQHVNGSQVQDFRRRIEAFGQRQTCDATRSRHNRKRTSSQVEQDLHRPTLREFNPSQIEAAYPHHKKSKAFTAQPEKVSLDRISDLVLPSPADNGQDHYFFSDHVTQHQSEQIHQSSLMSFADVEIHDFAHPHGCELETPADQLDGFDFAQDSYPSDSDQSPSQPSTPDGPTFGLHNSEGGSHRFIDLSFLGEHERNVIIAMADRQKQDAEHLPLSYDDFSYAAQLEVAQPSAADYEAAFIEFMNVT